MWDILDKSLCLHSKSSAPIPVSITTSIAEPANFVMLSHRGRLPSWNRPGLCKRSGTDVRKLARDQLPQLALQASDAGCEGEEEEGLFQANSKALATIVQLEKNVLFLNQQHHETLEQLHKEIERLRSENRGTLPLLLGQYSKEWGSLK